MADVDVLLRERLPEIHYDSGGELLVSQWTEGVLSTPSSQTWIPPIDQGLPVIEGVFDQHVIQATGMFTGFGCAEIPDRVRGSIEAQSTALATVFQHLGYVGRCSFDTILVGDDFQNCSIQFIECNGRWGGTSLPMTLLDQLFGSWKQRMFVCRKVHVPGIGRLSFHDTLRSLDGKLFQHKSQTGRVILFNPRRIERQDVVSMIVLLDGVEQGSGIPNSDILENVDQCLFNAASQTVERVSELQRVHLLGWAWADCFLLYLTLIHLNCQTAGACYSMH